MEELTKVTIGDSDFSIYVNEQTHKGRQLVVSRGILYPKVTDIWGAAASTFSPDLVLDIGCGYGDILFSTEYEKNTKIVGIEANQVFERSLVKSKSVHMNNKQIELKNSISQLDLTEQKRRKLLFRMNLQGNETVGLKTLEKLTKGCEGVVGIVDFNSIYLEDNGTKIDDFLAYVKAHYKVFILKSTKKLINLQPLTHYLY